MPVIAPQKQMTGMLGHPVAENPIDRMFDAVYAHHGLHWQFWKNDIANEADLALAVAALRPLGYRGMCVTVPWKVAVMPLLDAVDDDVRAIGAANYITIKDGRLTGHNNDGKGVVKAIAKVASLKGQRVVMLGAGGSGSLFGLSLPPLTPSSAPSPSPPPTLRTFAPPSVGCPASIPPTRPRLAPDAISWRRAPHFKTAS